MYFKKRGKNAIFEHFSNNVAREAAAWVAFDDFNSNPFFYSQIC